ncbi:MAG: hypothetical protein ACFFAO_02210 [Candidatus Hermodarchaeota archaeon]
MKFKKFLGIIKDLIMEYPDIDLKTLKLVIEKFYQSLSNREKEMYVNDYKTILDKNTVQKTMNQILFEINVKKLQTDIDFFKKSI